MNPVSSFSKPVPLIAAPPTPFAADGSMLLPSVEAQAARLLADGVDGVFVGGTTGEASSLTRDERLQLAERWAAVLRGTSLRFIVHVGSNCLADARHLAAHAERIGASGIAAVAPCYFRPADIGVLLDLCATTAAAAPGIPFHYYEIPSLTGIHLASDRFLAQALDRIPSLAGLKFSNTDLVLLQKCAAVAPDRLEILYGSDDTLLAALAYGATGAVGSTYNIAAPLYRRMIAAAAAGDFVTARKEQLRSVQLVEVLNRRGFLASLKALLDYQGIPMGPVRLPLRNLDGAATVSLLQELESTGALAWTR
jgi:N-acetylneuraminate lyase